MVGRAAAEDSTPSSRCPAGGDAQEDDPACFGCGGSWLKSKRAKRGLGGVGCRLRDNLESSWTNPQASSSLKGFELPPRRTMELILQDRPDLFQAPRRSKENFSGRPGALPRMTDRQFCRGCHQPPADECGREEAEVGVRLVRTEEGRLGGASIFGYTSIALRGVSRRQAPRRATATELNLRL